MKYFITKYSFVSLVKIIKAELIFSADNIKNSMLLS